MRKIQLLIALVLAVALPLMVGQGCPSTQAVSSLTAVESSAMLASARAIAAVGQAVHATQQAATDQSASGQGMSQTFDFGTCPHVTGTVMQGVGIAVELTIDFGATPCSPAGVTGYACSGSADGAFNQTDKSITLTFQNLTCNNKTVTGTSAVTYAISPAAIGLTGQWDLGWSNGAASITTTGTGTCSYDRTAQVNTIPAFSGQLTSGSDTWSVTMTDVQVSYANNGNLIPMAGSMAVSGPGIRTMTIRFNETSPSTGDVEVSFGGAIWFAANLFTE